MNPGVLTACGFQRHIFNYAGGRATGCDPERHLIGSMVSELIDTGAFKKRELN